MAKTIQFTAEELAALQSFYSKELSEAKRKVKTIEAILKKIGTVPKKRGRKPASSEADINSELKSSLEKIKSDTPKKRGRPSKQKDNDQPAKRRGRPRKVEASEQVTEVIASAKKRRGRPRKVVNDTTASVAPKKRGRPKKNLFSDSSNEAVKKSTAVKDESPNNTKQATTAKKRGRPKKNVSGNSSNAGVKKRTAVKDDVPKDVKQATPAKKRGRPKKVVQANEATPVAKRRGRPKKVSEASNEKVNTAPKKRGRPAKSTIANSTAKKRGRPAKSIKSTSSPKLESTSAKKTASSKKAVKKVTARTNALDNKTSLEAKIAVLENQVEKAKEVIKKTGRKSTTPKKEAKKAKLTYNSFILDLLTKEERFLSTPEINESAFEAYRTKESDKRKIKSTLQTTLHRLETDKLIQLRKKIGERISYWAVPSVSDHGFIKEKSKTKK